MCYKTRPNSKPENLIYNPNRHQKMSIFNKLFRGSEKSVKKFDLEKLLSSDDINNSIIELDNFIGELCSYVDNMNKLTEEQKQFYYNQCLEREVNNGGFHQYFFNSSGNFAQFNLCRR